MKYITYDVAANLLAIPVGTLRHGVKRGALTKVGKEGKNVLLIEEQVKLFIGQKNGRKKWLSLNDLNNAEKTLWRFYEKQAQTPLSSPVEEETMREIARQEIQNQLSPSSQLMIDIYEGLAALLRMGVPQGNFFKKHPILAQILYGLIVVASVAGSVILFSKLSSDERREVLAYLQTVDALLEQEEQQTTNPLELETLRQKRQRIKEFQEQVKAA